MLRHLSSFLDVNYTTKLENEVDIKDSRLSKRLIKVLQNKIGNALRGEVLITLKMTRGTRLLEKVNKTLTCANNSLENVEIATKVEGYVCEPKPVLVS